MSHTPNHKSTSEFLLPGGSLPQGPGDLTHDAAARLMGMGVAGHHRPLDRLLERLASPGAANWFLETLRNPPVQIGSDIEGALVRGKLGLEGLDQLKERCKVAALTNTDSSIRLASTGGYYFAIAAAALHYRRLITSQPKAEIGSALADLSAALPDPWSTFLARAALEVGIA